MSLDDLLLRGEDGAYILVDFDRTLATYTGWDTQEEQLGKPIPAMVERVQRWLHLGVDVRIFTARASRTGNGAELDRIRGWCVEHIGKELPIQNWKCFKCVQIWDDLAVTVEPNTGERMTVGVNRSGFYGDPLRDAEEADILLAK